MTFLLVFLTGCTVAGSKYVKVYYTGHVRGSVSENIAIASFMDKRGEVPRGFLGKRILNSGSEEVYLAKDNNLSGSVTRAFKTCLIKSGYIVENMDSFELDKGSIKNINKKFKHIVTGEILEFDFFANKGFATTMVLDIKLVIHVGDVESGSITTVPVSLNLKRKDIKFSIKRVENFINQSLSEVINRAVKLSRLQ